jgi:hypothetical protein
MNRVRSIDDLVLQLRRIAEDYRTVFGPLVARLRSELAGNNKDISKVAEVALECHARQYAVNCVFTALNWRMNLSPSEGLPSLTPEVAITSSESGRVLFLDYFGRDTATNDPLLIVEAKRPSASLPRISDPAEKIPGKYATKNEQRRYLAQVLSRGLRGEGLSEDWSKWLAKMQEYVRSVYERVNKVPRRVVMTNGDWLIAFLDPRDAFLKTSDEPDPDGIVVFENYEVLESEAGALFRHLEYWTVCERPPTVRASEIVFYLTSEQVDRAMHGVRLRYGHECRNYGDPPAIWVAPVLFVRSKSGMWIIVDEPAAEFRIPQNYAKLKGHLTALRTAAKKLLGQTTTALGSGLRLSSLVEHYNDKGIFAELRGVTEEAPDRFLVATGQETHYLLPRPSVLRCPFHDWSRANEKGVASGYLGGRSVDPRAYFISGETHHCSHSHVELAKGNRITAANSGGCGSRSGKEGQAFCEIWRFETHLCCRTCVFEMVCTKAEVFRLPCERVARKSGVVSN